MAGVGCEATFKAIGACTESVQWTAPWGTPQTGTGPELKVKWTITGPQVARAKCPNAQEELSRSIHVVAVDKIIVEGSDPEQEGPIDLKLGLSVQLRAKRKPDPAEGPWPEGQPTWTPISKPPFAQFTLSPSTGGLVTFVPGKTGEWVIQAKCCDSVDEFTINVTEPCGQITGISASGCYERVNDSGPASEQMPFEIVGPRGSSPDALTTLTVTLAAGADPNKVTWQGATQDPANKLKASVNTGVSVKRTVTILYDGVPCRQAFVWPVWSTVSVKIAGTLDPSNTAAALNAGNWADEDGGGKTLGPIDKYSTPTFTYQNIGGRVEATALLTPAGVGMVINVSRLKFSRRVTGIAWFNAGHYVSGSWQSGPDFHPTNEPDTSFPPYLDMQPSVDDKLFDLDVPGLMFSDAFHTGEMYMNFLQFVTYKCGAEFVECSDQVPWSYSCRLDKDKPANKVEHNELKLMPIVIPTQPHYSKR